MHAVPSPVPRFACPSSRTSPRPCACDPSRLPILPSRRRQLPPSGCVGAPLRDLAHGLHATRPEHPPPRSRRAAALGLRPIPSRSQPRLRRRRAHRAQLRSSLVPESVPAGRMGLCQTLPAALASRGRPGTQADPIPLAASPAPPPRPSRPALTWPCPRERLNGIAGTSTLLRARGPPIPQPRGPRSQAPRRRRPPLQKSSYCSHSPPEGTLAS